MPIQISLTTLTVVLSIVVAKRWSFVPTPWQSLPRISPELSGAFPPGSLAHRPYSRPGGDPGLPVTPDRTRGDHGDLDWEFGYDSTEMLI
jgi:hypothetical protein